jgi:hypothetical protein
MLLKYFFYFCIFNFFSHFVLAQKISFTVLQSAGSMPSLYDAQVVKKNVVKAFGKNGSAVVISKTDTGFSMQNACSAMPSVYKCIYTENYQMVLCDSARLLSINSHLLFAEKLKNWNHHLFYCGEFLQQQYFIGSMKTGIASAKKMVPFGRLLIADENGKVKNVKKYWASAIWDVYKKNKKIEALKYNIFGTRILQYNGKRWGKKKHYSYLLHKTFVQNDSVYYCGANNFKRKCGIIICPQKTYKIKNATMIWDIAIVGSTIVACANDGKIFYKNKDEKSFNILETKVAVHLYDVAVVSDTEAIIVGQSGVVVKVDIR